MSVELLDKTRKIGRLLRGNSSSKVVFNDICAVLSETLESNTIVLSRKGKTLGLGYLEGERRLTELISEEVGGFVDPRFNDRLLGILSTRENVNLKTLGFSNLDIFRVSAIISPVDIAGERLGTLFIYRYDHPYDIDDIILSEYGTTVVGLETIRSVDDEIAEDKRKKKDVTSALGTLSASEQIAIRAVVKEMKEPEMVLVASHLADREGITRSVIVNALRKMESAGVLEARSSGMKGTRIRVLNDAIYSEFQ